MPSESFLFKNFKTGLTFWHVGFFYFQNLVRSCQHIGGTLCIRFRLINTSLFCHLFTGSKAVTEMYQRRDFSLNDTWEALFDRRLGQRVEVMVRIPSNAPVGKEMFRA